MNRIVSFFEDHVEKMVLVVVGLVCAWLLITRVIFSPNVVSWDDRNLSPSAVDDYVYEQAKRLNEQMRGTVDPLDEYKPRAGEFRALLTSAIPDVAVDLGPVVPKDTDSAGGVPGIYRLPTVGDVSDVAVEHIRAVAYIPVDEVTPQNPYDKAGNEPNDLDLVSVEAKFDVEKLYESWRESFIDAVEEQWADPCLAKPVFAAVQLQRQQLNADGNWSDWQDVPRARIDQNKELFEIREDVADLPGGLKVQMLQYDYKQTQIDLLQPEPYQFASARVEWFPPSLYSEFEEFQRRELQEERRQAREDEKEARERDLESRRSRRAGGDISGYGGGITGGVTGGSRTRGGTLGQTGAGGYGNSGSRNRSRNRDSSTGLGLPGEGGRGGTGSRRRGSSRRSATGDPLAGDVLYGGGYEDLAARGGVGTTQRGPRRPTINDVYVKYDEIALTRLTDFSKIREPLVFWRHDDTVEPGNTYRYRIRLGVFNPIAGTNRMDERDKSLKNQAILWSGFSDTTEPVEIMGRLYFFATGVREGDKTVTVQVSRLTLGHWYSDDFPVQQGELVGKSVEYEPPEPDRRSAARTGGLAGIGSPVMGAVGPGISRGTGPGVVGRTSAFGGTQDQSNIPETIDYSTGAVLVDAVAVSDWKAGRTMRARRYYDMLYSFDGINIMHMPIERQNWPTELQDDFGTIARLQREPQEPFKAFGSGGSRRRGGMYDEGYGEDMMYEEGYGYEDMMMY